jgi:hypothetical protein
MRVFLSCFFCFGILLAGIGLETPAAAANYPWCAYYGGTVGGGGTNCGFTTFQQCLATVSGIGGFCDRNTQYRPPVAAARPHYRSRHRRYPQQD